jgi:hypothetical protein
MHLPEKSNEGLDNSAGMSLRRLYTAINASCHPRQLLHPLGGDLESVLSSGLTCDRPAPFADFRSHQPDQSATHVSCVATPQAESQASP